MDSSDCKPITESLGSSTQDMVVNICSKNICFSCLQELQGRGTKWRLHRELCDHGARWDLEWWEMWRQWQKVAVHVWAERWENLQDKEHKCNKQFQITVLFEGDILVLVVAVQFCFWRRIGRSGQTNVVFCQTTTVGNKSSLSFVSDGDTTKGEKAAGTGLRTTTDHSIGK